MAALDDWLVSLLYETAMEYPADGLRRGYWNRKKSPANLDDGDMADFGYTPEMIAQIKSGG